MLAALALAYGLGLVLTVPANPEVGFWREVMLRRDAEIATARKSGGPCLFFTGGSSTAFSIDPAIIEQACGRPAFNLGLPIASGAPYILHQALKRCQSGDTLVVCLEADVIAHGGESHPSTLSFALGALEGDVSGAAGGATLDRSLHLREALNLPRPGPQYLTTLAARVATGKGYRYTPQDIRYHGRIETSLQDPSMIALGTPARRRLHPEAETLLSRFVESARQSGVRVFYSQPWRFTSPETIDAWRLENKALLADVARVIPVLEDPSLGASADRQDFSDSHQHLTAAGSKKRTELLASVLAPALQDGPPR